MTKLVGFVVGLLVVVAPSAAWAHGSQAERAARLDHAVETAPDDPDALAARAALELETGSPRLAIADLEHAARLDASRSGAEAEARLQRDLLLGRAHLAAGDHEAAGLVIARLLEAQPAEPRALYLRARLHAAEHDYPAAASDLERSIAGTSKPAASAYLELSQLHVAAGEDDLALAALTVATERLGTLAVLVDAAVEIEVRRGRFGDALGWSDRSEERLRESPGGRARRAELLAALDRWTEAEAEAGLGLETVEALPDARKSSTAIIATRARLQATVDTARAQPPAPAQPPGASGSGWVVTLTAALLLLVAGIRSFAFPLVFRRLWSAPPKRLGPSGPRVQ